MRGMKENTKPKGIDNDIFISSKYIDGKLHSEYQVWLSMKTNLPRNFYNRKVLVDNE